MTPPQRHRLWARGAFFLLFVAAPPLDLLRYDLIAGHFWLFGQPWTLGLDAFRAGTASPGEASLGLVVRGFVPLALLVGGVIGVARRYGRLYCGWLCPHFSVVETINGLMRRACGKPTLWLRKTLPAVRSNGAALPSSRLYWIPTAVVIVSMAFLWAITLLSYLLPPTEIWGNLLAGTPTRNQALFLGVATTAFLVEFTVARHLFCRYACAVGVFQSLAWMANRRALVVRFDAARADQCRACFAACDNACPMRLRPRGGKQHIFTCTQCSSCITACTESQASRGHPPLLHWVQGEAARQVASGTKRTARGVAMPEAMKWKSGSASSGTA
jgi:polyferredoxin